MFNPLGFNCAVCGIYTTNLTYNVTARVIINGKDIGQFVTLCDEHIHTTPRINHHIVINTLPNTKNERRASLRQSSEETER